MYSRLRDSIRSTASAGVENQWASKYSARRVPLMLSTYALSIAFPGLEKSVLTWLCYAHKSSTWLVNSLPLSQNSTCGVRLSSAICCSIRTTSCPFRVCPTSMAEHSRV